MSARRPPRRGEIWFVFTPGQPDDIHQPRPGLVISRDVRNRLTDDVMVIPIFSSGRFGPSHIPLPRPTGGIPHDSLLFCEELTRIDQDFLARGPLGGPVPHRILEQVLRGVRRALGEVIPEP